MSSEQKDQYKQLKRDLRKVTSNDTICSHLAQLANLQHKAPKYAMHQVKHILHEPQLKWKNDEQRADILQQKLKAIQELFKDVISTLSSAKLMEDVELRNAEQ